ncbi:MAG: patatin-like phospholipase family protein [Rickettsia endosymbiont of Bryobia graminum]|nr:patatin-like phospholipase family protein [Rickettsia endosymbiont of Bryobia graminum]
MQKIQETPFDYLVFSGGGAKGAIYSGAHKALEESGVIKNIKAIAGSSAGAITAAVIASGIEPEEFEKISKNTNLKELLGNKGFSAGLVQISKDGTPLYKLLDSTIRNNVSNYLKDKDFIELCNQGLVRVDNKIKKLKKEEQELLQEGPASDLEENIKILDFRKQQLEQQANRLENLRQSNCKELHILRETCSQQGKIFFKDLALLRLLDPEKFKDLYITAVNKGTGELEIFNADNTPDIEIALACRASASIPVVFEPVKIGDNYYVDGGYRDNIPMKYFATDNKDDNSIKQLETIEDIKKAKQNGRVLALAFGSGMDSDANIAIYSGKNFDSPTAIMKFFLNVLLKMVANVGGKFKYTKAVDETNEELRENALNTIALDTQGISTMDFDDAQKYSSYLHIKGYLQTLEYLDNHQVGKEVDKNFNQQKFLLSIYEEYDKDNLNKTFSQKILDQIIPSKKVAQERNWQNRVTIQDHDQKAKQLLSYCADECWNSKDSIDVLKSYIRLAATARNNEVRNDTNAIKSLIVKLNDSTTPSKVKSDFKEVLGLDVQQKDLAKYKFTKDNFTDFIQNNKQLSPHFNGEKTLGVSRVHKR